MSPWRDSSSSLLEMAPIRPVTPWRNSSSSLLEEIAPVRPVTPWRNSSFSLLDVPEPRSEEVVEIGSAALEIKVQQVPTKDCEAASTGDVCVDRFCRGGQCRVGVCVVDDVEIHQEAQAVCAKLKQGATCSFPSLPCESTCEYVGGFVSLVCFVTDGADGVGTNKDSEITKTDAETEKGKKWLQDAKDEWNEGFEPAANP